jgi:hypothetical protein
MKPQLLPEIEFRPFKRQPITLTTSAISNGGKGPCYNRHTIVLVRTDSSSFPIDIFNQILILAIRATLQTNHIVLNLIRTTIFGKFIPLPPNV